MFCKEKPAGTVASHAWPFLLRRIRLEALSYRRRTPEKRNTPKHTTDVDNLYYVKLKFSNLLTSDYIRLAAASICKFCNVYVRLRAASDFQQDSRCPQNNGMAA